jgi:hypothetical protein
MYNFSLASGFVVVIAGVIGLIRFKKMLPSYQPFVYFAWLSVLNDLLSAALVKVYHENPINGNIYVLLEAYLFLWLFRNWGIIKDKSWTLASLLVFLTMIWIYDNFIWHNITTVNSLFRICYSFVLIFLAINQLNKLIVGERGILLRNTRFLICIGICIFYSYKASIEVFYLLQLQVSNNFYSNIFLIHIIVNLFVNLIYGLAALWIPTKQRFTLSS